MSPHTVRAYVGDIRSLLAHLEQCGIADVAEIDIAVLRAWLATQHAAGQSRATIARRAAAARAFTAFVHERGWLAADPGIHLGSPKTKRHLPEVLAADEIVAVLEAGAAAVTGDRAGDRRAGEGRAGEGRDPGRERRRADRVAGQRDHGVAVRHRDQGQRALWAGHR